MRATMKETYSEVRRNCENRACIIKAMAHPTRLFIVEQLAEHEHCVHELTEMIGATTSTISDHLAILRRAGLVSDDRRGKQVYYSICSLSAENFIRCADCVLRSNARQISTTLEGG